MPVYLIHFNEPYKHAQHYTGWAHSMDGLNTRLTEHACGNGARLMKVIAEQGITWKLARVWEEGDRELERRLKKWHGAKKYCPICRQKVRASCRKS